ARDRDGRPHRARPATRETDEPPLRLRASDALRTRVKTAICPGSYDPVTLGHIDIITRAATIFDRVVVGVVRDPQHKSTLFAIEERVSFLNEALAGTSNVEVDVFSEL